MPVVTLLEREIPLVECARLLGVAAAGHGSLLFVGGEAGVGKTTLAEHVAAAAGRATRVLTGACDPLSTPRPLAPLLDIAMTLRGEIEGLILADAPRDRLFRAFLATLGAGPGPTLVVFEDVHWADEATLDLLRFLGRRAGTTRALLLATYRDDEIGPTHPLRLALGDLATASAVRRLALRPLSVEAVRVLVEGSDLDPVALHRQTGGNPFFVTEILAAGDHDLPPTVRDAVLARAARLSPAGRVALETAAVFGARVAPATLAAALGDGAAAMEECVAAGLLRADGLILAFRHELARAAILDALSPPRAARLHAVALAVLCALPGEGDVARLAHHAEGAGDSAAVLTHAPAAAAEAARLNAHREAAGQYARALRFAAGLPPAQRAALLEAYAAEAVHVDRLSEAIDARREALALHRAGGDRRKEGESLSELALLLVNAGRNAEAEASSQGSLALLEALPPGPELAHACRTQAALRMLDRDSPAAITWGERALALAERFGQSDLVPNIHNVIGTAMLVADDERGLAHLERCLKLARAAGYDAVVALAFGNLGSALGEQYRLAAAGRYLAEGIAYCAERDLDRSRLYMLAWQALVHLHRGAWSDASEAALAVVAQRGTMAISRIMALVALGRLRARRGDPEALTALDEALALAEPTGTLQRLAPVRAARAEVAWLAGDPVRAAAEAKAAFALAERHGHAWFIGELGYWRWRAGDLAAPPPGAAAPFARQMAGDWAGAAALWEERGCPYEAARALADGDDESALRRALATFERLGARPMAQIVARRLRERGARAIPRGPRPSTRANAAGLTRREIEIITHMAAGLRNGDIADRLSLSPKTVEHHVSAILAKLGVRDRAEAAREATRRGLLTARQSGGEARPK